MSHIETIRKYCRAFRLDLSYGGNTNARIHMMERCVGGNLLEIHLSPAEDVFANDQPYCWKLYTEVMVKRAKYDYEHSWNWEPKEFRYGKVAFHHWDCDELLKRAAEWLTEHEDHKSGLAKAWGDFHKDGDLMVPSIKCAPIGNLLHYTTMEKFKDE